MSNQKLISGTFYPAGSRANEANAGQARFFARHRLLYGLWRLRTRPAAACRGATMAESSYGSTYPEAVL
jgi:hypothetical protein